MERFTLKQLKSLAKNDVAIDLTTAKGETIEEIRKREKYLEKIGYAAGTYGCNGYLLKGYAYGTLYVVCGRGSNLYGV